MVPHIMYEGDDEDSMASDSMDEAGEEELVVSDMHVVADSLDGETGEEVLMVADSMDNRQDKKKKKKRCVSILGIELRPQRTNMNALNQLR